VGANDKSIRFWSLCAGTEAVIFVVDSNDRERIGDESENDQFKLFLEACPDAVVLVFANKQDLPKALSVNEVASKLNFPIFVQKKSHHKRGEIRMKCQTRTRRLETKKKNLPKCYFFLNKKLLRRVDIALKSPLPPDNVQLTVNFQ
jgi:GTPase SAR1 family protein